MEKAKSIFSLCLATLFLALPAIAGEITQGKVIGITDGDTIKILASGNTQIKVRLYGIDCPEKKQAFGARARQAASKLAFGKIVKVEAMQTDRYARLVGVVSLPDGRILNRELLSLGMAWLYPKYCKASFCKQWKQEENKAREAGHGLWIDKKPLPPWDWRQASRKK